MQRRDAHPPAPTPPCAHSSAFPPRCHYPSNPSPRPPPTLYLSKNGLQSLEGVGQFRRLRALSVADNALPDLAALGPLATLRLEAASFEGCPVAGEWGR